MRVFDIAVVMRFKIEIFQWFKVSGYFCARPSYSSAITTVLALPHRDRHLVFSLVVEKEHEKRGPGRPRGSKNHAVSQTRTEAPGEAIARKPQQAQARLPDLGAAKLGGKHYY